MRPDVIQSRTTSDASLDKRKVWICLYDADRKQVTGSGSKNNAPFFDTAMSMVCTVVVDGRDSSDAFGRAARTPDRVLKTLVDPLVEKSISGFSVGTAIVN